MQAMRPSNALASHPQRTARPVVRCHKRECRQTRSAGLISGRMDRAREDDDWAVWHGRAEQRCVLLGKVRQRLEAKHAARAEVGPGVGPLESELLPVLPLALVRAVAATGGPQPTEERSVL